jgi:hypothetical protein
MARNARKRERHRLKRQQKKRRIHRVQGVSTYRRASTEGEIKACYINSNWRENGQASIFCVRSLADGSCAVACFLVDIWCMGLKDAYGRLDMSTREIKEDFLPRISRDFALIRVEPEVVRSIVAGGIRFARDNGFRLPKRYQRWAAFLGEVGDTDSADISEFGVGGKLRYFGTMDDLRKRLIGCTVDQFLERKDVEFYIGYDDFSLLDDEELEFEERYDEIKHNGLDAACRWCFANGIQPHPKLPDAWDVLIEAMLQTDSVEMDRLMSNEEYDLGVDNLERLIDLNGPRGSVELREALAQLAGFVQQFESPQAFNEALGIKEI